MLALAACRRRRRRRLVLLDASSFETADYRLMMLNICGGT